MSARNRVSSIAVAALTLSVVSLSALAGPNDITSNFPVRLTIGGVSFNGIDDSGGFTSLSFEDAKAAGLLDANGDPVNPPSGELSVGGTGGASVACHRFNNVSITVQPKNVDGTNNGPPRTIKAAVVVPKKPSSQTGASDAEKERKTNSMKTKAGRNLAGAVIDGHKLDLKDQETDDPNTNRRSTGWVPVAAVGAGIRVPIEEDPNQDDGMEVPTRIPHAELNGVPMSAYCSGASVSIIPEMVALQLGGVFMGGAPISRDMQDLLFIEGLWPFLPQQQMQLPVYAINVVLPTLDGVPVVNEGPALFLAAPFIQQTVLGCNALVPQNKVAYVDSQLGVIFYRDLCPPDFDASGFLDTDDFDAFVLAFQLGDPSADFDGSGFVDTDDFDAFVRAFEEGC